MLASLDAATGLHQVLAPLLVEHAGITLGHTTIWLGAVWTGLAVVGVRILWEIRSSKMAVALLTTFYGAFMANLLFIPLAGKLGIYSKEESMVM